MSDENETVSEVEKAAAEVLKELKGLKADVEDMDEQMKHRQISDLARSVLLTSCSGGAINFYQGNTDEVALRCIAFAESLFTQLEARAAGLKHTDAERIAQGDIPVPK